MESILVDRTQPPAALPLQNIPFPAVREYTLSNGIPVYMVQFGGQEILDLSILLPAGRCYETEQSVASFTAKMIQEGTRSYNALAFARRLDFFGASVFVESGFETATVGLSTLTKHMAATIPLLQEMLLYPTFPEDELEKMRQRTIQHLDVEEKKTSYVARKLFGRLLFGVDHPYGRHADREDVERVTNSALKAFHARYFNLVNGRFVLCGRFDEAEALRLLDEYFGGADHIDPTQKVSESESQGLPLQPAPPGGLHYHEMPESMQATLRVGHRGVPRQHPDHYGLQILGTVLGGYFGSRLMKNIREDKGYTYGIGAGWVPMKYSGLFLIQTDVGNEYIRPTLAEVEQEIQRLLQAGVREEELSLVKNYMLGRLASARETPSQIAGIIRNVLVHGLSFAELDAKFDRIQAVTAEDLMRLAHTHFHLDAMVQVVCGKMPD